MATHYYRKSESTKITHIPADGADKRVLELLERGYKHIDVTYRLVAPKCEGLARYEVNIIAETVLEQEHELN